MEVVSPFDVTGMKFTSIISAKVSRFRFRGLLGFNTLLGNRVSTLRTKTLLLPGLTPSSSISSMNLALTDPFILAQDYPEALTGKLSMNISILSLHYC